MMQKIDLKSYLEERKIYILNEGRNKIKNQGIDDIFKQVGNILLFQSRVKEYRVNLLPRIGGSIGREIDNYNCAGILLEKYLGILQNKKNINLIDSYLIKNGDDLLQRAKQSLKNLCLNNYRKLIKRSMCNYEVCLGRVDEGNLIVSDNEEIFIGTIKYLTYNIKEHDIYSYIKKIKKRDIGIDIDELISFYIEKSSLDNSSKEYLKSLTAYPNEEFKIVERYILGKITINEREILENLHEAKRIDNKYLII